MTAQPSLLSTLLELITRSTYTLQHELANAHLPEPWLRTPALHPWDEHPPPPTYSNARRTLLSALAMMTALVQNPREQILISGMGYHHPAALNFTVRTRIPDILANPDVCQSTGLHVDTIAYLTGTHPAKTAAILRFLCTHHIFTETAPLTFTNNRLSHCLRSTDPTSGAPIFWGELAFRAATALSSTLRTVHTAHALYPAHTPFSRALAPGQLVLDLVPHASDSDPPPGPTVFSFLSAPEHTAYLASFTAGMRALELAHGPPHLCALRWAALDVPGAIFVDVGASTGHLARALLPILRHARFICQDRAEVCVQGRAYFAENEPDALREERVTFHASDFLAGQAVQGATVYILSNILHDWPEKEGRVILRHIVEAMTSESTLLIIERVVVPPLAPLSPDTPTPQAPWPLNASHDTYTHHQAVEMLSLFNSLDRSREEWEKWLGGMEGVRVGMVWEPDEGGRCVFEVKRV